MTNLCGVYLKDIDFKNNCQSSSAPIVSFGVLWAFMFMSSICHYQISNKMEKCLETRQLHLTDQGRDCVQISYENKRGHLCFRAYSFIFMWFSVNCLCDGWQMKPSSDGSEVDLLVSTFYCQAPNMNKSVWMCQEIRAFVSFNSWHWETHPYIVLVLGP